MENTPEATENAENGDVLNDPETSPRMKGKAMVTEPSFSKCKLCTDIKELFPEENFCRSYFDNECEYHWCHRTLLQEKKQTSAIGALTDANGGRPVEERKRF